MTFHKLKIWGAMSVASTLTAACATPPSPPVLQASFQQECATSMSLLDAVSLTPAKPAGTNSMIVPLDATSACVQAENGQSGAYQVFALPLAPNLASISAGAVLEPLRTMPVDVLTLDASGQVVRQFEQASLKHRGSTLSVLFRPEPTERFVAVRQVADMVGDKFSFISTDVSETELPDHAGKRETLEGYRAAMGRDYSFEGSAFALVFFNSPEGAEAELAAE